MRPSPQGGGTFTKGPPGPSGKECTFRSKRGFASQLSVASGMSLKCRARHMQPLGHQASSRDSLSPP